MTCTTNDPSVETTQHFVASKTIKTYVKLRLTEMRITQRLGKHCSLDTE